MLRKIDWYLFSAMFAVSVLGLLSLASVSSQDVLPYEFFWRQAVWLSAGIIFFFIFVFLDLRSFERVSALTLGFYILSFILLAATIFFGKEIRGTRGWLTFGPINFQPVELINIALILVLGKYFILRHLEIVRLRHFFVSGFYVFAPALILFLQPDLGSVIVMIFLWIGIIFSAGVSWRHFVVLFVIFALLGASAWFLILKPYHKERFLTLFNPSRDPLGIGYNVLQSKIAIGSAGIFGKGFGNGTQARFGFLPEAKTDFLFAAFFEEWGLVGAAFLFALFILIFYRCYAVIRSSVSNFNRFLAAGLLVLIESEFIINIGMNLGALPVIGIPLPFFSYGGSSIVSLWLGFGILQGLCAREKSAYFGKVRAPKLFLK